MIYIIITVIAFLIFFIIINLLRKLHWDVVHQNLLALTEEIGGQVVRKNMLGRPILKTKYKNLNMTVNFSSERSKKGRQNYIDISMECPTKGSFTISSLDWIREQNAGSAEDFVIIESDSKKKYGIRDQPDSESLLQTHGGKISDILHRLDPFLFIYAGANGILFEKTGGNLAISTRHPGIKEILDVLIDLSRIIK